MIFQNAIKIVENYPKESFLVSSHVHDYKSHTFKDGYSISVDGGREYIKRGGASDERKTGLEGYGTDWVDWSLDNQAPFEIIKQRLLWGTYGKSGKEDLKYVTLYSCSTEHLFAIMLTPNLHPMYKSVVSSILKNDRKCENFTRTSIKKWIRQNNEQLSS